MMNYEDKYSFIIHLFIHLQCLYGCIVLGWHPSFKKHSVEWTKVIRLVHYLVSCPPFFPLIGIAKTEPDLSKDTSPFVR